MDGRPGHPWDWLISLTLGVAGTILSALAIIGIKGARNILRDIETNKLRIQELERRLDRMENGK